MKEIKVRFQIRRGDSMFVDPGSESMNEDIDLVLEVLSQRFTTEINKANIKHFIRYKTSMKYDAIKALMFTLIYERLGINHDYINQYLNIKPASYKKFKNTLKGVKNHPLWFKCECEVLIDRLNRIKSGQIDVKNIEISQLWP